MKVRHSFLVNQSKTRTFIDLKITRKPVKPVKKTKNSHSGDKYNGFDVKGVNVLLRYKIPPKKDSSVLTILLTMIIFISDKIKYEQQVAYFSSPIHHSYFPGLSDPQLRLQIFPHFRRHFRPFKSQQKTDILTQPATVGLFGTSLKIMLSVAK